MLDWRICNEDNLNVWYHWRKELREEVAQGQEGKLRQKLMKPSWPLVHYFPKETMWTGLNSHITQSHEHKRPGWMSMYTSRMICPSILAFWTISSLKKQTSKHQETLWRRHFILNNIILYRSKLHSSKPFFGSTATPRICSTQIMMTEIKLRKLSSYHSQLTRVFLPSLISEPGLADSMSALRHHLTKDFRNFRNNLFKENSISRILWLCSKVIKYKWE